MDLPKKNKTVVSINNQQMGVGGDDAWGTMVHDEYLNLTDREYDFEFVISLERLI